MTRKSRSCSVRSPKNMGSNWLIIEWNSMVFRWKMPATNEPDFDNYTLVREKNYILRRFGCQMNVYDSQRMADVLAPLGYGVTDSAETADMIILNTCHIREKAAEKLYSELGRYKSRKTSGARGGPIFSSPLPAVWPRRRGPSMRRAPLMWISCWASNLPSASGDGRPGYARPRCKIEWRQLPRTGGCLISSFRLIPNLTFCRTFVSRVPLRFCLFRKAATNFARSALCLTRGVQNIPGMSLMFLQRQGTWRNTVCGKLRLLGQNVNAYRGQRGARHGGSAGLGELIQELANIDGLDLIRYTTSHPADMDAKLIQSPSRCQSAAPFLHLPVQSGSNNMLHRMNRRHKRDDYLRVIEEVGDCPPRPQIVVRLYCRFPGEFTRTSRPPWLLFVTSASSRRSLLSTARAQVRLAPYWQTGFLTIYNLTGSWSFRNY